jgi:hypothetical protein
MFPRLLMGPRVDFPPVDNCRGTKLSHAAMSRVPCIRAPGLDFHLLSVAPARRTCPRPLASGDSRGAAAGGVTTACCRPSPFQRCTVRTSIPGQLARRLQPRTLALCLGDPLCDDLAIFHENQSSSPPRWKIACSCFDSTNRAVVSASALSVSTPQRPLLQAECVSDRDAVTSSACYV